MGDFPGSDLGVVYHVMGDAGRLFLWFHPEESCRIGNPSKGKFKGGHKSSGLVEPSVGRDNHLNGISPSCNLPGHIPYNISHSSGLAFR